MRARILPIAILVLLLPVIPAARTALSETELVEAVEHVHGVDDNWKLHVADEPAEGALDVRKTDNIEQVGRLALPGTTDMQFQRRTGDDLILDGEPYEGEYLDIAVAGGMSGPNGTGSGGLYVLDVTDPTDPTMLSGFTCGGFHSDVAIYDDLAILGHDTSSGACEPPADGRDGGPPLNGEGIHIFDITDPANPVLVRFLRQGNDVPRGPHNITVNVEDGLLYFSFQALGGTPYFGYFDLKDLSSAPVYWQMRSIDSEMTAVDSCHDIGLAHGFEDALGSERDLLFCAAVTGTYIWDIADPTAPQAVSKIFNAGVSIHHGARLAADGKTLVLNDELAGAAAAYGCQGGAPVGSQWFYDISVPEAPVPIDAISTDELDTATAPCTSHFYNFLPYEDGTQQMVTGWYKSGVIVHDFSDHPVHATTHAYFDPDGAVFWAGYAWHGYLYGSSYAGNPAVGGIYVLELDGLPDLDPVKWDEGTSWARWPDVAEVPAES